MMNLMKAKLSKPVDCGVFPRSAQVPALAAVPAPLQSFFKRAGNRLYSVALGLISTFLFSLSAPAYAQVVDLTAEVLNSAGVDNAAEVDIDIKLNNTSATPAPGATYTISFAGTASPGVRIISTTCVASGAALANCPTMITVGDQVTGTFSTFNPALPIIVRVRVLSPGRAGPTSVGVATTITVPSGFIDAAPGNNATNTNLPINYRPIDLIATPNAPPTSYALGTSTSYSVTYTNQGFAGSGPADGSRVQGVWNGAFTGGAHSLAYTNLQVQCVATGNAVCPTLTQPGASGVLGRAFGTGSAVVYDATVPVWPVGGSLTFTYSANIAADYTMICNLPGLRSVNFTHTATPTAQSGLDDSNTGNNVANSPVAGPVFPDCTKADVEVVSRTYSPGPMVFNTPVTTTIVYRNNGPAAADRSRIEGIMSATQSLYNYAHTSRVQALRIDSGAVNCVSANGAVCPTLVPTAVAVAGVVGYTEYNIFNPVEVSAWPAGGEITVTYTFTPREYIYSAVCATQAPSIDFYVQGRVKIWDQIVNGLTGTGLTDPRPDNNFFPPDPGGTSDPTRGPLGLYASSVLGPELPLVKCPEVDLRAWTGSAGELGFFPGGYPGYPTPIDPEYPRTINFNTNEYFAYVYANKGPDSVPPSIKIPFAGELIFGQETNLVAHTDSIAYRDVDYQCVASGGAQCPAMLNLLTPPAAASASPQNKRVIEFKGDFQGMPAGGEVRFIFKAQFTAYTGPCSIANPWDSGTTETKDVRGRFMPSVSLKTPAGYTDTNLGNNATFGGYYAGYGPNCVNPSVSKSVTNGSPNVNGPLSFTVTTSYPTLPGVSLPEITGVTLTDVLPTGFVYDLAAPGAWVCNTTGTATCAVPTYDPVTRTFTAVIPSMQQGSTLSYTLNGQALNFSSGWSNTAKIALQALRPGLPGQFDPNTANNSSTTAYSVVSNEPKIFKQALTPYVLAGQAVRYRVILTNPSDSTQLDAATITDTLPAGFTYASTATVTLGGGATRSPVSNPVVGSSTPIWGSFTVPSGGDVTIEFEVNHSQTCGATVYNNSAAVNYTQSGTPGTRGFDGAAIGNDSDNVTIICPPVLSKTLASTVIAAGGNTFLIFNITPAAAGGTPYTLPFSFTDTFPSGWDLSQAPIISNTCGGTVTNTSGGTPWSGGLGVMLTGGLLPNNGTSACSVTVRITSQAGQYNASCATNPAAWTNGSTHISGLVNLTNGVSNQCLVVNAPNVTMSKRFSPWYAWTDNGELSEGQTITATITLSNPAGLAATVVSFTDNLPLSLRAVPGTVGGTCSNAATAVTVNAAGTVLTATNLDVPAGNATTPGICTVTFQITHTTPIITNASCATSPSGFTNLPGNVVNRSANLEYDSSPCMLVNQMPTLTKRLTPSTSTSGGINNASITDGGIAVLTFTLTNSPSTPAQSSLGFTDSLPAHWRVSGLVSNSCGGTVTNNANTALAAGMTSIRLTNGALLAGQTTCTTVLEITNATGQLNASCSGGPTAWTNSSGNINPLSNLINGVTPQCLEVLPQPGRISITKAPLASPAGATGSLGSFDFGFTATCDLPTAGRVFGPVTLSNFPTVNTVDIFGIPGGATCTVAEVLPTAPVGYAWATPTLTALTPTGTMPANGVQTTTVTNALTPVVSVSKVLLSGPTQVAGNPLQHDITYRVAVTNNTAASTNYNLSDTLGFEPDVSVVGTPTVTHTGGVTTLNASFTGAGSNTALVTNEPLAANGVETFDVTVRIQMNAFNAANNTCTGATANGLFNSATLTVGLFSQTASACANTPASVPVYLKLRKNWVSGISGDVVSIPVTSGFSTNTAAFSSTNSGTGNFTDSAQITVVLGESGTLPTESFTTGSALNYVAPASWVCANEDGTSPLPTTVAQGGTLTLPAASAAKVLRCTLTNTGIGLDTVKTATPASGTSTVVGNTLTYTLTTTVSNGASQQPVVLTDTLSAGLQFVTNSFTVPATPAGSSCTISGQVITCTLGAGAAIGTHVFSYQATVLPAAVNNSPAGVRNTVSSNVGTCSTCSTNHSIAAVNFKLRKAWVGGVANDAVNISASSGFVNNTAAFSVTNTGAGNSGNSAAVTLSPGISGTLPTETFTTGNVLDYAVSQWVCRNDSGAGAVTNVAQGGTLTIPTDATGNYTCTLTNTGIAISTAKTANPASGQAVPIAQTLTYTLTTSISGAASKRVVTLTDTLSAGLQFVANSFTVPATPVGSSCTITGQVITCTLPVGAAVGNYAFTYQAQVMPAAVNNVPSGVTNAVTSSTGTCATCSTNHPVVTTELVLRKQWQLGVANDAVTIPATSGFVNNTAAFNSVNLATGNQSDSAVVLLAPGLVGTLPTESFTTGSVLDYQASAWICRNSDNTGSDIQVAQGTALTIPVASAGKRLICTLTNTGIMVNTIKTANPASGTSVTEGDTLTYTLGTAVAGGATKRPIVLTDTMSAGLTLVPTSLPAICTAAGQVITCTHPVGLTVGAHTITYTATVNANAANRLPTPGVNNSVKSLVGTCSSCTTTHGLVQVDTYKRVVAPARTGPEGSGSNVADTLNFTVTATVIGGATTQPLVLVDSLSVGLELTSIAAGCTGSGRSLTCTLPVGSPAGVYNYSYSAIIKDDAGDLVSNVVRPSYGTCKLGCTTQTRVLRQVMLRVTKTASPKRVKIGDFVRYEVLVENLNGPDARKFLLIDQPSPGLSYVEGSLRIEGDDLWVKTANYPLTVDQLDLPVAKKLKLSYLMRVGASAGRGDLCNKAWVDDVRKYVTSNTANACVARLADPDFEETRIFGVVFDDVNGNGVQDQGESGIAGVRLATATGLIIETDAFGRYNIEGIDPGQFSRGSNFIVKVDPASLAAGSVFTTQNPLVKRLTWAIPAQYNFGVQQPNARFILYSAQVQKDTPLVPATPAPVVPPLPVVTPVKAAPVQTPTYGFNADGLFKFDKYAVEDIVEPGLSNLKHFIARVLLDFSEIQRITLRAHTDRFGSDAHNRVLSGNRAKTIKALMVRSGISEAVIDAQAVGSSQPVVSCEGKLTAATVACLLPNRRFEIQVQGLRKVLAAPVSP